MKKEYQDRLEKLTSHLKNYTKVYMHIKKIRTKLNPTQQRKIEQHLEKIASHIENIQLILGDKNESK
ncbi:hypothetical protein K9M79_04275 [Candidatus Woesearchaeota archaeon]|nr:hypothetical protein [Candidatus Woesearchaeota archaeon]